MYELEKYLEKFVKKEELYRFIIDQSSHMVFINDFDGNYICSNKLDIIGYSEEELKNQNIFDLINPVEREIVLQNYHNLKKNEVKEFEYQFKHKNGKYIYLQSKSILIIDKGNKKNAILSNINDVTEETKTKRFYKDLFENMIDGFAYHQIVVKDGKPVDYIFIDINDAFTKITGITKDRAIGKKVTEVLKGIENDPSDWIGRYGDVALNGKSIYFESKAETLNQDFLVHAYSPEPGFFVAIFTDITTHKKEEEDRLKILKLESLSLLAGGIAHDYNNLLASILGNVNLLQLENGVNDSINAYLKAIENATFRARDLTNQLLTFSRGGTPVTKPTSIQKIIEESISFCLSGSKSIAEVKFEDNLPILEIDPSQISQVFNNLLINANQAMSEGGVVKITVKIVKKNFNEDINLPNRDFIEIMVQDNGIGIKNEIKSRIFDPYFTTKSSGTGLGLATAYSIISRHNGKIEFDSVEGEGTSFYVYLPIEGLVNLENTKIPMLSNNFKGKILVMDDNIDLQILIKKMLVKLGFTVDVAINGQKALEFFLKALKENDPYSVIIMDLTIPGGLGGKETLTKILDILPSTKAIVSSGYSNDHVLSDYGKYGFKGRIVKPFTYQQLQQELYRVLNEN